MNTETADIINIIDEREKKELFEFLNQTCNKLSPLTVEDFKKQHLKNKNSLTFTAPESICSGYSGIIILMIEFYHLGIISLEKVEKMADNLINYCRQNPSQDYSLFAGRSGTIYTLIQLFEITNKNQYLKNCLELIQVPDFNDFINSSYTSDYIFNGRAGTLLTLVNLYLLTKDEELSEYISLIYLKILNNCEVAENGISWKEHEEINIKNSSGFAFGAAGIKYSLQIIYIISQDPGIDYIIKNIDQYINSNWDFKQSNFKNFEKDILNKELFSEYLTQYTENKELLSLPSFKTGWNQGLLGNLIPWNHNYCYDSSQLEISSFENISLFSGSSSLGLFYLKQINTNQSFIEPLKGLTKKFIKDIQYNDISGGLFFGELSKTYFLLKLLNNNIDSNNILEPFYHNNILAHDLYCLDVIEVRTIILGHFFKRTLEFLQESLPRILNKYFSSEVKIIPEINNFIEFIENILKNFKGTKIAEQLEDIYLLEKKRYDLKTLDKESNITKYFENFVNKKNSLEFLDHDDSWFLKQSVEISKNVCINQSKWNWTYASDKKFLKENLQKDAESCEYIIMLNEKNELIEYYLGLESIILKTFRQNIQIEAGINDLKSYLLSQPYEKLILFSRQSGSKDMDDFLGRLDFLLIQRIRYFIFSGILNYTKKD